MTRTKRLLFRRALIGLSMVALLALALIPAMAAASGSAAQSGAKPTIVLVHGAWAGPSSWDVVVRGLHDDGYKTSTPRLGLTSLAADVATVRTTLDGIAGEKILVAHSYGGAVISDAAAGRSDVLALVYAAAFVPVEGDSLASLGTGFKGSDVVNHLLWSGSPFSFGSLATIDPAFFPELFAQDLSTKKADDLNAAQQPIAFIPVFVTPSGPVAWHTIPSWYAVSAADRMIDPAEERFMAARAGAKTVEFNTASHVGGITRFAGRFTDLIEEAVGATAG